MPNDGRFGGLALARWPAPGRVRAICASLIAEIAFCCSAFAAAPYIGNWATSAEECEANPLIILSEDNAAGATFGCESASYAKDGDGWKVAAKRCAAEGDEVTPADMTFRIAIDGGKLQVFWDDGTKSAKLVRCGG